MQFFLITLPILDQSKFRKLDSVLDTFANNPGYQAKKIFRKKIFFKSLFNFGQKLAQVKTILAWWTNPISSKFLEFCKTFLKSHNWLETREKIVFTPEIQSKFQIFTLFTLPPTLHYFFKF